jgi:hypothetical protein
MCALCEKPAASYDRTTGILAALIEQFFEKPDLYDPSDRTSAGQTISNIAIPGLTGAFDVLNAPPIKELCSIRSIPQVPSDLDLAHICSNLWRCIQAIECTFND